MKRIGYCYKEIFLKEEENDNFILIKIWALKNMSSTR